MQIWHFPWFRNCFCIEKKSVHWVYGPVVCGITVVHWSTMDQAMTSGAEHAGDGRVAYSEGSRA
jgi:hypothetical protein